MTVDPSDSSYTPSLVVTSVGESLESLVEVKSTHVKENEHTVKLLENVQEVQIEEDIVFYTFLCQLKKSLSVG